MTSLNVNIFKYLPLPNFLDLTCIGQVNLADYPQWADEDGYWLGEYTFMDGNGDPLYDPNYWNYPYDHYKGFIAGSVDGGSYSQRNVFLYPPQTVERCALDDQVKDFFTLYQIQNAQGY